MRALLVGASGFIGTAVAAHLRRDGHEVVGVVREINAAARAAAVKLVTLDVAKATGVADWLPHLPGIDAVVNCAGVLQDSPRDSTAGVHHQGIAALFAACEQAGVRRIVHLSAIGVDREAPSEFSRSKLAGDRALMARDLDWVILRPSVVLGRQAVGASALFRGLAALPVMPVLPGTGPLQVVQLDELTRTILFFLERNAPSRLVLEIVGPERLSMVDVVRAYSGWFGWKPAPLVAIPGSLAAVAYRAGDFLGWLGWRPPVRSTARLEIVRGAVGDPEPWMRATGIAPRPLARALGEEPAGVQERWFAKLYFLKPLAFATFALFWIGTGIISLTAGWEIGKGMLTEGGFSDELATAGVIMGAIADILIGVGIAFRRTAHAALWGALAISFFYAIAGTIVLPRLWADPLGPMLKIWPIVVLNLIALAILKER